jgi:hypothetical protein
MPGTDLIPIAIVALGFLISLTLLANARRYDRLKCPHCAMSIRYRGASPDQAERYRQLMNDHIRTHTA